jgi:hypothetical protein
MRPTLKRQIAKFFIKFLALSTFIRRLQPIATEIAFGEQIRPQIDELRKLLITTKLSDLSYVRFGDLFDGGYVLSNAISKNGSCLSVGVGTNISFDVAISKLVNEVHLYDHTVSKLPQTTPPNIHFFNKGLGVSTSGQFLSLHDCLEKFSSSTNMILKIDIEGAEWEILDSIDSNTLLRFDQIAIEFHDFFRIRNQAHFLRIVRVLAKLNETHTVINVHGNNWGKFEIVSNVPFADVLEVTYISKSILDQKYRIEERDSLNKPCNPLGPEIELAF